MIRIGVVGSIGSGKSYVSKSFGFPLFNADIEVAKLYKKDKTIFIKLKKILPEYFNSFPVKKKEVAKAILAKVGYDEITAVKVITEKNPSLNSN